MSAVSKRPSVPRAVAPILAGVVLLLSAGCNNDPATSGIDLTPFKAMAASADCDDVSNRLFLVDERQVFWDRRGNCPDNNYSLALLENTVETILCEQHDSIGGPNTTQCTVESYRVMFDTMIHNLDDPNLGLGTAHSVEAIPF